MNKNKTNLNVLLINPFVIFSDDINSYDDERLRNKSQFIDPPLGLAQVRQIFYKVRRSGPFGPVIVTTHFAA
jgi:hypothetical protein